MPIILPNYNNPTTNAPGRQVELERRDPNLTLADAGFIIDGISRNGLVLTDLHNSPPRRTGDCVPYGTGVVTDDCVPYGTGAVTGDCVPYGTGAVTGDCVPCGTGAVMGDCVPYGTGAVTGDCIPYGTGAVTRDCVPYGTGAGEEIESYFLKGGNRRVNIFYQLYRMLIMLCF